MFPCVRSNSEELPTEAWYLRHFRAYWHMRDLLVGANFRQGCSQPKRWKHNPGSGPKPLHFFIFWQPCHTCTRGATNPTRRVCTSYLYDLPHAHRAAHLRLFRVLPLRDNITSPKLPFALGLSMTVPLLACVLPLSRRCSAMPRPWPAERSQTERPYTSFKGQRRLLPLSAVPQA